MYKNIYFLGIGGIGMSAIARYYRFKGFNVAGYDKTPSELTGELEKEGIKIHYSDDVRMIPSDVEDTLVVYTPAIPESLEEMKYVREHQYKIVKRSMMLGEISKGQECLAVAGSHGKTTTSTLLAHILTQSGEGCSAFLGGISKNYGTNLLMSDNPVIVAEADEFDRSFHQLFPETAVITAMDADHLDIYGDLEHMIEAYKIFASQVSGTVIKKKGLDISAKDTDARILTYHLNDPDADFYASDMVLDSLGHYTYTLHSPMGIVEGIKVGTLGWVNVENSIAAAAAALCHGCKAEAVKDAIASFKGARRRMDEHVNNGRVTYIDDYAHHPNELSTALSSIREMFPHRKITAIFQPHLFTRTRDFADEFAEALSKVDKLILLDIYPAREEPIPGVNSEMLLNKVTAEQKVLVHKEDLMEYLENEVIDVLVTFGAGNIDRFISPITELLEAASKKNLS